jgi:nitroimidazol reductase NimA-like FMN-containing flavoprotein (pyridoxamine 5'-phosphate oxidase superfamily)
LFALLASTPLATVALIRDGHPVIFPTGFARIGDELVIHGSTGSPWLRALSDGVSAAVSVTALDGIVVARSGFESSFHYRSATVFGVFERVAERDKVRYLETLTDTFIPGRVAELRSSTRKELAATLVLRLAIGSRTGR